MNRLQGKALRLLCVSLLLSVGSPIAQLQPATSAERLTTNVGLEKVAVPLDDLERFAKTGEISPQFALVASQLNAATQMQLRGILLQPVPINAKDFSRLMEIPLTEPLVQNVGKAFRTSAGENGARSIRTALDRIASMGTPLNLLSVMRQFPGDEVQVDLPSLIQLTTELTLLTNYRDAAVKAVVQEAEQEASKATVPVTLPDLRQSGTTKFTQRTLTLQINAQRQTQAGLVQSYTMPVDLYVPQGLRAPAPVVVMSHGFGAGRDAYAYLARHLASHGFVVAAPEHIGSNLEYRRVFLAGKLDDIVTPAEHTSRSRDITYLLNELERLSVSDRTLAGQMNLNQIGVIGNSLGGTTALSVAGATLNIRRLQADCTRDRVTLSPSFLVQCVSQTAASGNVNLGDRRIKAVFAAYPLTSNIFGPEGMGNIAVPTLLLAGSKDIVAPVVQDQIHPFIWLTTPRKYLALMIPGTHFSSSEDAQVQSFPPSLTGTGLNWGRSYLQGLSTAFFKAYLNGAADNSQYRNYLSAANARTISQNPLQLYLIQSLSPDQLQQAYGSPPPSPIIPTQR